MSIFKKISMFTMLLFMSILFLAPVNAKAATVGDILKTAETGWQRIDDTDSNIIYSGTWFITPYFSDAFMNHQHDTTTINSNYKFKFYGTKLRLITNKATSSSSNISVIIDGKTYNFSAYGTTGSFNYIVFEKNGLDLTSHTVIVTNLQDTKYMNIDAIDIDNTGYLIPYNQPTNLVASSGNNQVSLTWDSIEGATDYIVKRSDTPGGPYSSIEPIKKTVSGSAITCIDTRVTPGTTYYYVVSAIVSGIEGPNSNEASVTPTEGTTPPDHTGNTATLILTMTNGGDKVYNVSLEDLDTFLTWYDNRSTGEGRAYYVFNKTTNIAPYVSIKEYISFDKISSFEVKEYNQ